MSYGISVHHQGLNPGHGSERILTTRPPGNSQAGEGFNKGFVSLAQCLGAEFPTYLTDHVLHVFSMLQGCGLVSSMMMWSLFGGKFNIQILNDNRHNIISQLYSNKN